MVKRLFPVTILLFLLLILFCGVHLLSADSPASTASLGDEEKAFLKKVAAAALERTKHEVTYIPDYVAIDYPMGDVPADQGVCTDVIIRTYRKLGIDLQQLVHEDMAANFNLYPAKWGNKRTDTNIDHRRVPNLRTFFERKGIMIPITDNENDYHEGDLVTWDLGGGIDHIGIVIKEETAFKKVTTYVVHNIAEGPKKEKVLFKWKITGHYRYFRNK